MRLVIVCGLLLAALGCPTSQLDDRRTLHMEQCTRLSRLIASTNCDRASLDCKLSILEPVQCAALTTKPRTRTLSEIVEPDGFSYEEAVGADR